MKLKTRLLVLAVAAGVMLLCQVAWADSDPTVGKSIGNVSFSAPVGAEDAAYLGLSGPSGFTLSDVKAPYVLIESFNST